MKKIALLFFVLMFLVSCNSKHGDVENVSDEDSKAVELVEKEDAVGEEVDSEESVYDLEFEPGEYQIVEAFPGMRFDRPVLLFGDGDGGIYVVEKKGRILKILTDRGAKNAEVFLDITDRVSSFKSEKGLLGAAFHPDLKNGPFVFVCYTDDKGSVVSRFEIKSGDTVKADPKSELAILRYDQPYSNHNGGHIEFGGDGYLYIASGDGGSAGDPKNNGQNLENLLGKILRIDVENISREERYRIPEENPFAGNESGYREEIYAYGLRNPWRFSFDEKRGILLAADVGQDKVEEIDIIENGGNYGWPRFEGSMKYKDAGLSGGQDAIVPVWEYGHKVGKSITGGYAYYGSDVPSLYGTYVYGDFVSGKIWAMWINEDKAVSNVEILDTELKISSFGLDDAGEIYVVDYRGSIYRIVEKK